MCDNPIIMISHFKNLTLYSKGYTCREMKFGLFSLDGERWDPPPLTCFPPENCQILIKTYSQVVHVHDHARPRAKVLTETVVAKCQTTQSFILLGEVGGILGSEVLPWVWKKFWTYKL